jgi:hypothetical protein
MLVGDSELASGMGLAGQNYVALNYKWPVVLSGFERTLALAKDKFNQRPVKLTSGD